jgi:four helix bundle protein
LVEFGYGGFAARGQLRDMTHRDLDVLDAADRAADGIDRLVTKSPRRLLHVSQMRSSVQSIGANISEGFGRGKGRDRVRPLQIARGEAEETIRHLSANFRTNRIEPSVYWPLHNLLVVIVKMLNALINR